MPIFEEENIDRFPDYPLPLQVNRLEKESTSDLGTRLDFSSGRPYEDEAFLKNLDSIGMPPI